jgi:hypothetical protein
MFNRLLLALFLSPAPNSVHTMSVSIPTPTHRSTNRTQQVQTEPPKGFKGGEMFDSLVNHPRQRISPTIQRSLRTKVVTLIPPSLPTVRLEFLWMLVVKRWNRRLLQGPGRRQVDFSLAFVTILCEALFISRPRVDGCTIARDIHLLLFSNERVTP